MTTSTLKFFFIILISVTNAFRFLPETIIQPAVQTPITSTTQAVTAQTPITTTLQAAIAQTPITTTVQTPIITTVQAATVQAATVQASGQTLIKAIDQTCTRSQCYDKLINTIGSNIEGIIVSETNTQANYLSNFVSTKFSSYTGPLIAVAMESPNIISNIKSSNNIAAAGIVAGAVTKYKIGVASFATCSAWTVTYMGPYSIIPGFGCSVISTLIADDQINNIKKFMYGVPKENRRSVPLNEWDY